MINLIQNDRRVALLCGLAETTACTMVQKGKKPAFQIRRPWRIRPADLDDWISAQRKSPE